MIKTSKINLTPTAGYIILEPLKAETRTASGIYLPEAATEKPQKAKVLAVGGAELLDSGAKKESPVKVGDTVIYKKWGTNDVKLDGRELLFVKFEDILAIEMA